MDRKRIVYVDVDDTLIRTYGTKRIPMTATVDCVRRLFDNGDLLYCWSRGGGDYARDIADSLGLLDCFVAFLPKPDVVLDDRGAELLDYCDVILPGNAANH